MSVETQSAASLLEREFSDLLEYFQRSRNGRSFWAQFVWHVYNGLRRLFYSTEGSTKLVEAVRDGELQCLDQAANADGNPNCSGPYHFNCPAGEEAANARATMLVVAAICGGPLLDYAGSAASDPGERQPFFENSFGPLPFAALVSGNDRILFRLFSFGADLDVRDERGFTLLHLAAAKGTKPLLQLLMLMQLELRGDTARNGRFSWMRRLAGSRLPNPSDSANQARLTPSQVALNYGNVSAWQILLHLESLAGQAG